MRKKEIEIKIELTSEEFKNLVPRSGDFSLERTFGYFKEDFSNIKEGIFPRIKYIEGKQIEIVVTVKRKMRDNNAFFEREETEVKLKEGENIDSMREIIKSLGFSKEIIFEKRRKNMNYEGLILSFDELPFGFFMEVEGEPEAIDRYLNKFRLVDKPRITRAYLGLWEDYKKKHGIKEENCVFI